MYRLLSSLLLLVGGLFHASQQQNINQLTIIINLLANVTSSQPNKVTVTIGDSEGVPYYPKKNDSTMTIGDSEGVPYYPKKNDSTAINKNGEDIIEARDEKGIYLDECCHADRIAPESVNRTGCGKRNPEGVGFRITGDDNDEALYGEFPWVVAIILEEHRKQEVSNVYQCGGALIHPQVVLTAANCVTPKDKVFKIRAGEWDTQTTLEIYKYQERAVESVVIHPNYDARTLFNDVAVVFLARPFVFAPNIDTICLPPQGTVIPPGTRCFASGWGKDVFGKEGRLRVVPKKIDLPVVDSNKCQEDLRKTRLGAHFDLHKSFVCAGGEPGKDACKGDGGGPLICPVSGQENQYQQVGIVAWGIGCGQDRIPSVYANVPLFTDWINNEISKQNLDPFPK